MGKSPLKPLSVKTLMVSGVILNFVKGAPAVVEQKRHTEERERVKLISNVGEKEFWKTQLD